MAADPSGSESHDVKVLLLLRRSAVLSRNEFIERLLSPWPESDGHGSALAVPGLLRRAGNLCLPLPSEMPILDAAAGTYDAIEELWFDSADSAHAFFNSETGRSRLWSNRKDLLESGSTRMVVGPVKTMLEQPEAGGAPVVKFFLFGARRSDFTREQYHRYWFENHWPLVSGMQSMKERTLRLEFCAAQGYAPAGFVPASFDGSLVAWLGRIEDVFESGHNEYYDRVVRPDEVRFSDMAKSATVIAHEVRA